MQAKKKSWQRLFFMVVTILALMTPQTVFATGGTDGTELQVAEPASLEKTEYSALRSAEAKVIF